MKTLLPFLILATGLLLACTSTQSVIPTASAVNAEQTKAAQTAELLNQRYLNTPSRCAASQPAWHCSGVLVQAIVRPAGQMFWQHDADATRLGAQGLAYLRRDLSIGQLPQPHGVIFHDRYTAIADGKSLEAVCAYPLAQPPAPGRADYGCALPAKSYARSADVSSCQAIGVTDAATWLVHFQQQGNQPAAQCSLSSLDALQFAASLQAHEQLGGEWATSTNQLQVRNWDPTAPLAAPVQGLFYNINQTGALVQAQQDQRDYFNATNQWLPVLRMDLRDDTGKVFGFNLQDQLYTGYEVASDLNTRFANTSTVCGDKPAYFCNGVMIRAAEAAAAFHAWNPSANSIGRNGVSFSVIRSDVGTSKLAATHGFIAKASSAPAAHPLTLRCIYPANAGTSNIPDSCRASCEQEGIVTVEGWKARYASTPKNSCAFAVNAAQFELSVQVRTTLSVAERAKWNELIIAAWPQDIPKELPLEAFFYTSVDSRPHAQFIQRDYFAVTGAFLPVIKVVLTDAQPFSFDPADQLSTGTPGKTASEQQEEARHTLPLPKPKPELLGDIQEDEKS
ncbi:MAG TPA: hypothetical protein VGC62_12665 [Pseudomonas sp.]|uniref:hypothetical protein n=1 Tax=Pseudomonas sp. TaxID=306 RepID=UPI002EDA6C0B